MGDFVDLGIISETGEYQIRSVEKRQNEIFRVIVREGKKKVTAANCDCLVIITSAADPDYKRGIIDRFLVRAYQWGIRPLVVFNKMDLYNEDLFFIHFEAERLAQLGIESFEICANSFDPSSPNKSNYQQRFLKNGIAQLRDELHNKTAIFVGQSGVGKSKLISLLAGNSILLKTNEVGKNKKGTHTTTWSEIIDCEFFQLIDSPGVRSFALDDISKDELLSLFPDIEKIALKCSFSNCTHSENAKGCAFAPLWESDELADLYLLSRLESYVKILEELAKVDAWNKKNYSS
ncbi:MAG: ribosome small subunit-dependent GTPase A [Bdellovibrionales bacterium RIFOXYC2_FULL_39_8]|nr:MAG: ribosome small subunit-dependent GTPase A [Bdellovibrionales bacterium RIFOXYC2_FULL_39_8]HLE11286.1 ribosome small subunit-dependent GTPase A [Bacteriovoracaceae bacterium]